MADSFVFYRSFHEACKELSMEEYGIIMYALNEYALNGTEPENLTGVPRIVFTLMKPQIDANTKRRKAGMKGGRPKKEVPAETQMDLLPMDAGSKAETPDVKQDVSQDEAPKEKPKIRKFVRPSVEDIKEYCTSENLNVDAQRFFDYYESKGWLVGKSPMKDWKAACRTWDRNNYTAPSETQEDLSAYAEFFKDKTEI